MENRENEQCAGDPAEKPMTSSVKAWDIRQLVSLMLPIIAPDLQRDLWSNVTQSEFDLLSITLD